MGGEQEVRAREEVEPKEEALQPGGWIVLPTEGLTTCEEVDIEIQYNLRRRNRWKKNRMYD
jgi:hypothetical protein